MFLCSKCVHDKLVKCSDDEMDCGMQRANQQSTKIIVSFQFVTTDLSLLDTPIKSIFDAVAIVVISRTKSVLGLMYKVGLAFHGKFNYCPEELLNPIQYVIVCNYYVILPPLYMEFYKSFL